MSLDVGQFLKCPWCDAWVNGMEFEQHVSDEGEWTEEKVYECAECDIRWPADEGDGAPNRCPDCGKMGASA